MNPDYKPIPSSIIAEGTGIWNGAKDRGDQAMIAYGAARFALASGDRAQAEELWPLIEWCLEYLKRKATAGRRDRVGQRRAREPVPGGQGQSQHLVADL